MKKQILIIEDQVSTRKLLSQFLGNQFQVIEKESAEITNEKLYDFLIQNGIPEFDAGEIIIFLPIAFCKKLFPDLNWHPNYIDFYHKDKKIKHKSKLKKN